jgi:hypothetical protein
MRKNKLIQLLQDIEGNPEIKLWNGMVDDWMDIDKLLEIYLYKENLAQYLENCRIESCVYNKDWEYQHSPEKISELTQYHKTFQWNVSEFIDNHPEAQKHHIKKKVIFLAPKPRGLKTWDRLGDIYY